MNLLIRDITSLVMMPDTKKLLDERNSAELSQHRAQHRPQAKENTERIISTGNGIVPPLTWLQIVKQGLILTLMSIHPHIDVIYAAHILICFF